MTVKVTIKFSENIKEFFQSGGYETAIAKLLERSVRLFPHRYEHNDEQSHGECDFYAVVGKDGRVAKYDVKLPFDREEGRLLCSNNADLVQWVKLMYEECAGFSDCVSQGRGICGVESLRLYKIIKKQLSRIAEGENLISFLPFPAVLDHESCIYTQFSADIFTAIYDTLEREGLVCGRRVYVIYPALDGKSVIRNLNNNTREFLDSPEINAYISYEFREE